MNLRGKEDKTVRDCEFFRKPSPEKEGEKGVRC